MDAAIATKPVGWLVYVACAALLSGSACVEGLNNGLGSTPGMGWNSDYCVNCSSKLARVGGFQNQDFIHFIADFIHSSGLQSLGYSYVNMDASWDSTQRNATGYLVADPALWPQGIRKSVDYVHSLGLGFGLYGDRGTLDCAKHPGNFGHVSKDAAYYAEVGIGWYKEDSCYASSNHTVAFEEYGAMRDALNKTGRRVWFALCGWNPWYGPEGQQLGNSWRIGPDSGSGWGNIMINVEYSINNNLAGCAGKTKSGGGWNDMSLLLTPDMGSGADYMTNARHRSQFSLYCVMASNLLMTGNLSALEPFVLQTWSNAEVIAVNQDPDALPYKVLGGSVVSWVPRQSAIGCGSDAYSDRLAPHATLTTTRSAHDPAARLQECGGEPALQQWALDDPMAGFLSNAAAHVCLNLDDCGTDVIYDACVTKGGTCAGPSNYSNEQWRFMPDGSVRSYLKTSSCLTVTPPENTLKLAPCTSPLGDAQRFSYDKSTKQVLSKGGLCLTAPGSGPPSQNSTLVVGRPLVHSAASQPRPWAVLFLNNGAAGDVECNALCFQRMGFNQSTVLSVRDLWLHKDLGTTTAHTFKLPVDGAGASRVLKFTVHN